jgi:YbbR domain-containing protein
MKKWLTYNLGLKLIALGLAIITWIYVSGEILRHEKKQHPQEEDQPAFP